ncbi:hypothetical protein F6X40_17495 [Paraburkholderia sp. UCT31]|uniref:hypothetical protein n=1 Tax=Paraburkholderia sp. UCT31 TaxID=2615209 RepID=UPI00165641DC|nr:hypothetical protein [Paraburkholderia sp. UCT31]MBC8738556.1 hypothetical protein [Paraburkholderia sp. UCT31]
MQETQMRPFRLFVVLGLFWLFGTGQFNPAHAASSSQRDDCLHYEADWTATERKVWTSACNAAQVPSKLKCIKPKGFREDFMRPATEERQRDYQGALLIFEDMVTSPAGSAYLTTTGGDVFARCFVSDSEPYSASRMLFLAGEMSDLDIGDFCSSDRAAISSAFLSTLLTKNPYRELVAERGLSLSGVHVIGDFNVSRRSLPGDIQFHCFAFDDSVSFRNTMIGGSLVFDDGEFYEPPNLSGSHVNGDLRFSLILFTRLKLDSFDMENISVDGSFEIHGLRPDINTLALRSSTVGSLIIGRTKIYVVDVSHAKIHNLFLPAGPIAVVDLENADIGGTLHLHSMDFDAVDATDAHIARLLMDVSPRSRPLDKEPTCSGRELPEQVLQLRGASIDEIVGNTDMDTWPNQISLSGLSFKHFRIIGSKNKLESDNLKKYFPCLLERATSNRYEPSTYQAVADYLEKTGEPAASAAVGFAGKNREKRDTCSKVFTRDAAEHILTCTYLWLSWGLVGYGYRLYLSIIWAAAFIGIGAGVFSHMLEARFAQVPIGFAYSFDMFLPLVRLRDEHYKIDVKTRVRYYLYVHKLAGWVLSSFIVAAVTGITK